MVTRYGPKQAVYPLDAKVVARSHSWPTYNLCGRPKLALEEKKGLTYGTFRNGRWSCDGIFVDPAKVNAGRRKIEWGYDDYTDFHGAIDLVNRRSVPRPIVVRNILGGVVVKVIKSTRRGQSSVWIESRWRRSSILWIYQHLDNRRLTRLGRELCTGAKVGEIGYLKIRGVDYSHLHLECISKKRFAVPENMILVCDSKTRLRSQFDYPRLRSVRITGKHYMYNGIFFIDYINSLLGGGMA